MEFLTAVNAAAQRRGSALPTIDEVVSKMADFLPSRSILSVCFPNCLLTSGEAEQLRKSKEIDKCINRDKTYVKRLVKILLLGAGESGKSTFLKQMRIIHGQDFDQKAKEEFRATIFSNVIKGKAVVVLDGTKPFGSLCVGEFYLESWLFFVSDKPRLGSGLSNQETPMLRAFVPVEGPRGAGASAPPVLSASLRAIIDISPFVGGHTGG